MTRKNRSPRHRRARWWDLAVEAFRWRSGHRLRTALATSGIAIGILSLTLVSALIAGVDREIDRVVHRKLGSDVLLVRREPSELRTYQEWRRYRSRPPLTRRTLDRVRPLVATGRLGAMAAIPGPVRRRERTAEGVDIQGLTPEAAEILRTDLALGRWFLEGEDRHRTAVCVLGSDVRDGLFGDEDPIGRRIEVLGRRFQVIGVGAPEGAIFGSSQDNWIAVPLEALLAHTGRRQSLTFVYRPETEVGRDGGAEELRQAVRIARGLGPGEEDDFTLETAAELLGRWSALSGDVETIAATVAGVASLVGGLLIMNVLLMDLAQRRKEIGVRRSVGARRGDVLRQVLLEAAGLALAGGAVGLVLAGGIAGLLTLLSPVPVWLGPSVAARSLLVALLVGVLAGVLPARRAVRLDPIECLRSDL